MDIAPDSIGIPSDDQTDLRMGLDAAEPDWSALSNLGAVDLLGRLINDLEAPALRSRRSCRSSGRRSNAGSAVRSG